MSPGGRRWLLRALDLAIAGTLALAALSALAGGLQLDLGLVRLSLRDLARPLAIAVALAAIRAWAAAPRRAPAFAPPIGPELRRGKPPHPPSPRLRRTSPAPPHPHRAPRTAHPAPLAAPVRLVLLALLFTAVGYWIVFLTAVCGGSDSYGYVSASRLLLAGALVQPQDIAAWLPVPNALDLASPAGYVPAGDRSGIVPLYPLGLPALMAVFTMAFGEVGPYLVAPVTGVLLVVLAARVAEAWACPAEAPARVRARARGVPRAEAGADATTGLLAAVLTAWNPLVMAYAKQPMSDVPAAMWFMAGAWCLTLAPPKPEPQGNGEGGPVRWIVDRSLWAGIFAGLSFVTRPGGVGAVALLAAMAAFPAAGRRHRLVRFAIGCAPLVALQAWLQWFLFGSPFRTGYGSLATLYAGQSAIENLGIYARGLLSIHPAWWFAALAGAAIARRRDALGWGLGALALGGAPYVLYFRFDHWETLRFLLPAVVLLSIAAATGIAWVAEVLQRRLVHLGSLLVILCAIAFAAQSAAFLDREGVPRLKDAEARYPQTAARVASLTPPASIVFAAQHSGSLRHYANRTTLRWELLRPEDLAPVLDALSARGLAAFVVLEGAEQQRFRDRFAGALQTVAMLPLAQVRDVQVWELKR